MIRAAEKLLERLKAIHAAVRDQVLAACERRALEELSAVVADDEGDTIFAIDRVSEAVLREHFDELAREWPCILIAEGLGGPQGISLPAGCAPADAELRIIVDPIDGTRGLMFQKRPGWILTGVAPNRGPQTNLADIELAIQTEIPLVKQHLCDTLWAQAGHGATGQRLNRLTGERRQLIIRPSRAKDIRQAYGGLVHFFPGEIAELAAVEDEVIERTLGPARRGKARAFSDQYLSTGGQLYELMMGHDRWIADLRPLRARRLRERGQALGLCAHPYDLSTELIAREAGVIVVDEHGAHLAAPLDTLHDVCWLGFANADIRASIEPVLWNVLTEQDWLTS